MTTKDSVKNSVNASKAKAAGDYKSGHRKRVKEGFMVAAMETSTDYELLEMILFLSHPRIDVKGIARRVIDEFGTINGIFQNIDGDNEKWAKYGVNVAYILKLLKEILLRSLITKVKEDTVLSSWSSLVDYLMARFGNLRQEQFSVLYLNATYKLLSVEQFGSGTIDESAVYVREVIKEGLNLGAMYVVLCHNHFSGEVQPSEADIVLTNKLSESCKTVNITTLDHIIVSRDKYFSFKENALM